MCVFVHVCVCVCVCALQRKSDLNLAELWVRCFVYFCCAPCQYQDTVVHIHGAVFVFLSKFRLIY